jgi:hypothetical protein
VKSKAGFQESDKSTAGPLASRYDAPASKNFGQPTNTHAALHRSLSLSAGRRDPADLLALQQALGNRAVGRMLAGLTKPATPPPPVPFVQAALTVGAADDEYEQEAERVAEQVSATPSPAHASPDDDAEESRGGTGRRIQRKELELDGGGEFEAVEEFSSQLSARRGGGSPLPVPLRARIEPRMGADFSAVRIHTDAQADTLSQSIHARAFTSGRDIFFRHGEYDPHGPAGQRLIAHELTHVMQQNGSDVRRPLGAPRAATPAGEFAGGISPSRPQGRVVQRAEVTLGFQDVTPGFSQKDYKAFEALNNKTYTSNVTAEQLPNLTFYGVLTANLSLKAAKEIKSFAADLNQPLTAGENTLTIKGKGGKKSPDLKINFPVVVEKVFKARGDLSNVVKFGTEFTFTNEEIIAAQKQAGKGTISTEPSRRVRDEWVSAMRSNPDVKLVEERETRYENEVAFRFHYEDGWWYQVSLDPGVLETQMPSMTLTEASGNVIGARIERDVFVLADKLGLKSDASFGGGHIHLDVESAFGNDAQVFRDFIVDFESQAMAMEAFEHDPVNAPRVAQDTEFFRQAFVGVIKTFDKENQEEGLKAIKDLAADIEYRVYQRGKEEKDEDKGKYNALNYRHLLKEGGLGTLEVRAMRAQRSLGEFLMQARMFVRRLELLEARRAAKAESPQFDPRVEVSRDPSVLEGEGKVLKALREYITELKLETKEYEALALEYRKEFYEVTKRDQM